MICLIGERGERGERRVTFVGLSTSDLLTLLAGDLRETETESEIICVLVRHRDEDLVAQIEDWYPGLAGIFTEPLRENRETGRVVETHFERPVPSRKRRPR